MRQATREIEDPAVLVDLVDEYAARLDGRLGVFVGYPRGPSLEEFDVLVSRKADQPFASASVIKLLVLAALYREHDDLTTLTEPREIAPENQVGGVGLLHHFDASPPSLRDLARAMITISDNTATNELIDYLGADTINRVATELGMTESTLGRKMMEGIEDGIDPAAALNPDGIRDADRPLNTTSPRDCARYFSHLLHGDDASARARAAQLTVLRDQTDRSKFPRYVPETCTIAHKTGWLSDAALDTGLLETTDGTQLFFAVFCNCVPNRGEATDVIAEIGDAVVAAVST